MSKKRFTKLATSHGLTHVVVFETCWHVSGVELLQKKRARPQSLTYAMQMFHDGSSVGNFNTTNIIKHLQKH